jgi:hypothetical protein
MLPHEQVAMNVRGYLARKGTKTTQVASVLEISPDMVRKKLRADNAFSFDEIGILANYLDVPFTDLVEGAAGFSKDSSPVADAT